MKDKNCRFISRANSLFVALLFVASLHSSAQSITTPQVRDVVRNGAIKATLPAEQIMHLDVMLPLHKSTQPALMPFSTIFTIQPALHTAII